MSSASSISKVSETSVGELRNVVLVGSSGSGKTTLFEHFLRSRIPGYRGERTDPERASALTLAAVRTGNVVINLLDAPGHPDFVGELRAGLRGADAAVFVVSATDGIDSATQALWQECDDVGMPRAIVLSKLDDGRTSFDDAVADLQEHFGASVQPAYAPVLTDGKITGNLSLVSAKVHDYSSGTRVVHDPKGEDAATVERYRSSLIEGIIQESENDALMDRYLEGEQLKEEELLADLLHAIKHGQFYPVIPVNSINGLGTEELLNLIEHAFPSPDGQRLDISTPEGESIPAVSGDPGGRLVAEVLRTTSDQFAGRLSMVRVYSGSLKTDDVVHVIGHRSLFSGDPDGNHPDRSHEERVGPITVAVGQEWKSRPSAVAGQIVMVTKLTQAETSDTLSAKARPVVVAPWQLPEPLLPVAIKAATRNDEDKLPGALARLGVEDTTVRLERTVETDQIILWTMGQAHIDLLLARLADRYGVRVAPEEVKVALRETFVAKAKAQGRHVKQSGGHGQYAVCSVEVEPLERGAGFEFVDKVVGGAVPRQFIGSVEKGVRNQLEKGVLAGYPLVDLRVTLVDGKSHSVDSSDMAFQMAGALALREAASPATVSLLEPIDLVTVTVAEEHLGAVMTDLAGRRGQVVGTDADESNRTIVKALVPQSELVRYAIDLRGIAHGSGAFSREFHGYEALPTNLVEAAVKEHAR